MNTNEPTSIPTLGIIGNEKSEEVVERFINAIHWPMHITQYIYKKSYKN